MSEEGFFGTLMLVIGTNLIGLILSAMFHTFIIIKTTITITLVGIGLALVGYGGFMLWKAIKPYIEDA